MSRKIKKGLKFRGNVYKSNTVYINNLSVAQVFELFDGADYALAKRVFENIVIGMTGVFMMVQISISARPNKVEWIDQLPSFKEIKTKIINGAPGMYLSGCIGLVLAYPYAREELESNGPEMYNVLVNMLEEMIESHTSNIKRIQPTRSNWLPYARGEMGSAKGQILSCPATNIKKLNIDGNDAPGYGIEEMLDAIGLSPDLYVKYDLDATRLKGLVKNIFLVDKGGIPFSDLIYNEPNNIGSKIQNQIFANCIIRTEEIGSRLVKGEEPNFPINKNILQQYLTKGELFAYDISIRTGDAQMTKKLTETALARAKKAPEVDPS